MSYVAESLDLKVLKCQRLYHAKPFNRRRSSVIACVTHLWDDATFLQPTEQLIKEPSLDSLATNFPDISPQRKNLLMLSCGRRDAQLARFSSDHCSQLSLDPDGHYFLLAPNQDIERRVLLGEVLHMVASYCARFEKTHQKDVCIVIPFYAMQFGNDDTALFGPSWQSVPLAPLFRAAAKKYSLLQVSLRSTVGAAATGKIEVQKRGLPSGAAVLILISRSTKK